MSLPRTSFTLRRLLLEPIAIYTPFTTASRHDFGAASCHLTTRRRPWAHQSRFASSEPKGTGKEKDPYRVLDVPRDVPQKEIQRAYYNQAKKLHPDASKEDRTKFQDLSVAYEKIKTPEARKMHDAEVRAIERERDAHRARDAAATPPAAQPSPKTERSQTSSGGSAKFVNRESLDWMKKYQRAKQDAEAQKEKDRAAQRERDLASQRKKDWAAQKQREMLERQHKQRRDREAALRDNDKPKEPDQTEAAKGNATSPGNEAKSEPKIDPIVRGKMKSDDNEAGAQPAQKSTACPRSESLRVAIFNVGAGASIEDVVKPLASSAIGKMALIQITPTGTAKLDFSTADAAHKLHQVFGEGKFVVNGKKVRGMTLHISALPIPQDPNASRVLVLTDPCDDKMPVLESSYVRFILRQEGHDCRWVEVRRLTRTKTEVHFSSFDEAERAGQILQNLIPGIHIRYGIDPATGNREPGSSFLRCIATGEDLPNTLYYRGLRSFFFIAMAGCFGLLVHEYCKQ